MRSPHRNSRSAVFVVVVTVLLFAAAIWTRAQDPLPTQPDAPAISCPDTVRVGEGLYGSANDEDQPVVVAARGVNGLLGGAPDTTQDGAVNSFCFPTDSVPVNTWIIITAWDVTGKLSIKFVKAIA